MRAAKPLIALEKACSVSCQRFATRCLSTYTKRTATPSTGRTGSRGTLRQPPASTPRRCLSQTARSLQTRAEPAAAASSSASASAQDQVPLASDNNPSASSELRSSPPSYYALFPQTLPQGPPPKGAFQIDVRALRREFLRLQAAAHPDFHAHESASASDRRHAEATSALLNGAFRTLANPLLRAQYLLREQYGLDLAGDEAGSIAAAEEDVLHQVLEAREIIEEAQEEGEFSELRAENEDRISREEDVIEKAFRDGDVEGLKGAVVRLRYWVNIRESVDNWEKGKPIVLEH